MSQLVCVWGEGAHSCISSPRYVPMDKDGVTNMTTDPSSPVSGQAAAEVDNAELQGTSSSHKVVLGARAGEDHTQPDPALRLCTV